MEKKIIEKTESVELVTSDDVPVTAPCTASTLSSTTEQCNTLDTDFALPGKSSNSSEHRSHKTSKKNAKKNTKGNKNEHASAQTLDYISLPALSDEARLSFASTVIAVFSVVLVSAFITMCVIPTRTPDPTPLTLGFGLLGGWAGTPDLSYSIIPSANFANASQPLEGKIVVNFLTHPGLMPVSKIMTLTALHDKQPPVEKSYAERLRAFLPGDSRVHDIIATSLIGENDFPSAIKEVEEALAIQLHHSQDYHAERSTEEFRKRMNLLCGLHAARGEWNDIVNITSADEYNCLQLLSWRINAYYHLNQPDQVLRLTELMKLHYTTQFAGLWEDRLQSLRGQSFDKAALRIREKAHSDITLSEIYTRSGRLEQALARANKLYQPWFATPQTNEDLCRRMSLLNKLDRYSESLKLSGENYQQNMTACAPLFYALRAECYFHLGQYPAALRDVNTALSINPRFRKANEVGKLVFTHSGDLVRAAKCQQQLREDTSIVIPNSY